MSNPPAAQSISTVMVRSPGGGEYRVNRSDLGAYEARGYTYIGDFGSPGERAPSQAVAIDEGDEGDEGDLDSDDEGDLDSDDDGDGQ